MTVNTPANLFGKWEIIVVFSFLTSCVLLTYGADPHIVSLYAKEGHSVTLQTDVKINPVDRIRWFLNDTRVAQIIGNVSVCTDVHCEDGDERFKGRLKLDHYTGSLTIRNIRITDSGVYKLAGSTLLHSFSVIVSAVEEVPVSAMEGDSLTLHTAVEILHRERIVWYCNDTRIALLNGHDRKICRDDECLKRFRDRLNVDKRTGSLTITNITSTDFGLFKLKIISRNTEKTFNVHVDPVEDMNKKKTKAVTEGESVTLDLDVNDHNDLLTCYFNDIVIAEITGDHSEICTEDQCKERFRDRLKVDHQTGSLTITNTTSTYSGEYKLKVTRFSNNYCIERSFIVVVNGSPQSSHVVARISVTFFTIMALFLIAVVIVLVLRKKKQYSPTLQDSNSKPTTNGHRPATPYTDEIVDNSDNNQAASPV